MIIRHTNNLQFFTSFFLIMVLVAQEDQKVNRSWYLQIAIANPIQTPRFT